MQITTDISYMYFSSGRHHFFHYAWVKITPVKLMIVKQGPTVH